MVVLDEGFETNNHSGAQQEKTSRISDFPPLDSGTSGSVSREKHDKQAPIPIRLPLVRNFLEEARREKTRITPRLPGTSGAQQRKNGLRPACRKLRPAGLNREKTLNWRGLNSFRNVSYNKCRDAHRKKAMFRLPGLNRRKTFVDLKTTIRNEPRYSDLDCHPQRTPCQSLFHIAAFAASRHK